MIPIEIKFLNQQIKSAQRIVDKHESKNVIKIAKELIQVNKKLILKLKQK